MRNYRIEEQVQGNGQSLFVAQYESSSNDMWFNVNDAQWRSFNEALLCIEHDIKKEEHKKQLMIVKTIHHPVGITNFLSNENIHSESDNS